MSYSPLRLTSNKKLENSEFLVIQIQVNVVCLSQCPLLKNLWNTKNSDGFCMFYIDRYHSCRESYSGCMHCTYTLGGLEAGLPIKAYHLPALPVQEGLKPKWAQPGLSLALWDLYHNIYIYVGQAKKECNAVTAKFNRMRQYSGSRISVRRRHNPKPAADWASIDFTPLVVPTPGIKINYLIRLFQSFHLSINSTFVLQRHEK